MDCRQVHLRLRDYGVFFDPQPVRSKWSLASVSKSLLVSALAQLGMMLAPILFACTIRKTILAGGFAAICAHSVLKVSSGLRKTGLCMRADVELGYIQFLSIISGIEQSTRKFTDTL